MATPFEISGVVLATFPLAIEGLKLYASGASSFRDLRNHASVVRGFQVSLGNERVFFNETCRRFFNNMLSDAALQSLMDAPGGDCWSTPHIQQILSSRLHDDCVAQVLASVNGLGLNLQKLLKKFPVIESSESQKESILSILRSYNHAILRDFREKELERIRKWNTDIDVLLERGSSSSRSNKQLQTVIDHAAANFNMIRMHAMKLLCTLKDCLLSRGCGCLTEHSVTLRLDMRRVDNFRVFDSFWPMPICSDKMFRFRIGVLLDQLCGFSELDLELMQPPDQSQNLAALQPQITMANATNSQDLSSVADNKTLHIFRHLKVSYPSSKKRPSPSRSSSPPHRRARDNEISDSSGTDASGSMVLWANIDQICTKMKGLCLGSDPFVIHGTQCQHKAWITSSLATNQGVDQKMRTLREVIDDKTIVSPLKGDRLQLAVRLASSLLQLHDTEWLPEVWGKDNVLVSDEITTDRYAVKSAFTRIVQISSPTAVPAVTPAQCSASLVCLGIVLVELLLWKPFEEIQSPREKLLIPFGELLSEIKTIERLITESVIQGEGGKKYAVAVRQCTGNLDIDDPRLSHDEFKNAVYARIVQPLEEHLKEFNGWEELPELL